MTGYADVVAAATVGLAQRRIDLDALPPELGYVADPGAAPAEAVLDAAALFDAVRRVDGGRVEGTTDPITAAPETWPALPEPAAATLWHVVGERRVEVLAEALESMRERRLRLSAPLIPAVLDLAGERASLRPLVGPVLGARGRLLCAHNPRWSWAVEEPVDPRDEQVWEHGSLAERAAWLGALRTLDPAGARDRLQRVWAVESAGHRTALLRACATGLSPADEPWLEELLDTPAVAPVARDLVARLPGSRLVARAESRVRASIEITRHLLPGGRTPELVCHPERLDAGLDPNTLATDGLATGEVLERFNNLVGLVPSGAWPGLLGLDAAALAGCRVTGLGDDAGVGPGLARVAVREANAELAIRLVHLVVGLREDANLLALVPMADREDLIAWALRPVHHDRAPALLSGGTWTESIATQVVRWLRSGETDRRRGRVLQLAARAMPVDSRIDFAAELRDIPLYVRLSPTERSAAFGAALSITLRRKLAHEIADREHR